MLLYAGPVPESVAYNRHRNNALVSLKLSLRLGSKPFPFGSIRSCNDIIPSLELNPVVASCLKVTDNLREDVLGFLQKR